MRVSEMTGAALDWAVAEAEHKTTPPSKSWVLEHHRTGQQTWPYSTVWEWGGPIIEREKIALWPDEEGDWLASIDEGAGLDCHGPTPLIAAMRCFVSFHLGATVSHCPFRDDTGDDEGPEPPYAGYESEAALRRMAEVRALRAKGQG